MELSRLPWWVWALISLPLGWLLATMNSGSAEPAGVIRTDRQEEFESAILSAPITADRYPWVRNLVVYPPMDALGPGNKTIQIMSVTYDALEKKKDSPNEMEYTSRWMRARIPYATTNRQPTFTPLYPPPDNSALPPGIEKTYVPDSSATLNAITAAVYGKDTPAGREALSQANPLLRQLKAARPIEDLIDGGRFRANQALWVPWNPAKQMTVIDWLKEASKDYTWVHYQQAWWKEPKYCQLLWIGGTFVLVGLIWPMAISVMIGAGLSGRSAKEEAYDLSHFGKGRPEPARVVAKKEIGEEELAKVAAMNAALTESLKEGLSEASGAAAAALQSVAPPGGVAKPFIAPPADAPAVAPVAAPRESKDYTGEFYPVAHPAVKPQAGEGTEKAGKK